MIEVRDDGRLYIDGRERIQLTEYEQDLVVKALYGDKIMTTREMARRQTSWGGCHVQNIDWFQNAAIVTTVEEDCTITERVYALGGQRLLTIYCNHFNFASAALDLGLKYGTLIKWYQRWRQSAAKRGLTPADFGLSSGKTV